MDELHSPSRKSGCNHHSGSSSSPDCILSSSHLKKGDNITSAKPSKSQLSRCPPQVHGKMIKVQVYDTLGYSGNFYDDMVCVCALPSHSILQIYCFLYYVFYQNFKMFYTTIKKKKLLIKKRYYLICIFFIKSLLC